MEALLDFVGEIYEASYKPDHWDHVMEQLCSRFMQAKSGAIFIEDHSSNTRSMIGAYGLPAAVRTSYRFGMGKYDHLSRSRAACPWAKPLKSPRQSGCARTTPFITA